MLDPDEPDSLGPQAVLVRCEQLAVRETTASTGKRKAIELEASGNILAESEVFTARGLRMTYAEAKDLLVLEGDGRTDAELFRQFQPGAERSRVAARKILYWPKTNKLWIDGARALELSGFGEGKN
jgi:hypothetical protein